MAFTPVPTESKGEINRAGEILSKSTTINDQTLQALELAERWRACHYYPINTFQATLRVKLRSNTSPIVAQRLKRMPTIIDKLRRYPNMKLSTMQDIGGLRAVLYSISEVKKLAKYYRKEAKFAHELVDEKNYIDHPRDEDGYRSVHLIYKYKNKLNPSYDGLRIELQIRTKLQHTWATAVETMGTLLRQALKSRQGDKEWLDFFALTSSAFAYMENTPRVPRYQHLSEKDTYIAVTNIEKSLQALEKMKAFSIAVNQIVKTKGKSKGRYYHLIILNSLKKTLQIKPYDRESFSTALEDYSKIELQASQGEKIEAVLVSAGPIGNLRRAYPNFFLDISEFSQIVGKIIAKSN